MKKLIYLSLCALLFSTFSSSINAYDSSDVVTLDRCVDGDTAHFIVNGEKEKVRFLAINAPEYTKEHEAYGKEASNYVCDKLSNATTIHFEYEQSNLIDKYDRLLAWVFVDGELLQTELVEQGLAEVKYIYGDYKYTDILYTKEKEAKKEKRNMWSNETPKEEIDYLYIAGLVALALLVLLFAGKKRKKYLRKIGKEIKKNIK